MKTIISLTSYPPRIDIVSQTIQSLLNQVPAADLVILYLAESEFPNKKIPKKLTDLAKNNKTFQIRWTTDTRSYKKLIPALQEFPNDIIIIADDDTIYPQEWLERLLAAHKKYPKTVIGHYVYRMNLNKPYRRWRKIQNKFWRKWFFGRPSFKNNATGVGGVLYPPHSLHPDVFNEKLFKKIAPTNDDLWFWAMTVLNGVKIAIVPNAMKSLPLIADSQKVSLWDENKANQTDNKNNESLRAIIARYPKLKKLI